MKQVLIASIFVGIVFSAPTNPVMSSLTIHTHGQDNCGGPGMAINNATYDAKIPVQIKSYHLNRELTISEALDFYNVGPNGGPIDNAYNGNPIACSVPVFQAIGGNFRKEGCSTLHANVGCVVLYTKG